MIVVAGIYRAEALYGLVFNFTMTRKVWDIYIDTRDWGPGLGASIGIVFVIVVGQTPKDVVGTTSQGYDFNLAFSGKIDGYIKAMRSATGLADDVKLGPLATELFSRMEIGKGGMLVHNVAKMFSDGTAEDFFNRAKILCNALSVDWSGTSFSVIDLPVPTPGLELGLVATNATVLDAMPW
jgi:hypothetical protein